MLLPLGVCKSVNKKGFFVKEEEDKEKEERREPQGSIFFLLISVSFFMWSKAEIVTPPGDNRQVFLWIKIINIPSCLKEVHF